MMTTPDTLEKVTVGYCPVHKWWFYPKEIGQRCWEDRYCNRTLVKRVGYICRQEGFHRTKTEARTCSDDHA
jgi:hypothetical protein